MILKRSCAFNENVGAMRNDFAPILWRRRVQRGFHEFEVRRTFIRDNEEPASVMFDVVFDASTSWSKYLKSAVRPLGIERVPFPRERGMAEKCDVRLRAGLIEE